MPSADMNRVIEKQITAGNLMLEGLAKEFLEKSGLAPDQVELCEQTGADGITRRWFRKRENNGESVLRPVYHLWWGFQEIEKAQQDHFSTMGEKYSLQSDVPAIVPIDKPTQ